MGQSNPAAAPQKNLSHVLQRRETTVAYLFLLLGERLTDRECAGADNILRTPLGIVADKLDELLGCDHRES